MLLSSMVWLGDHHYILNHSKSQVHKSESKLQSKLALAIY